MPYKLISSRDADIFSNLFSVLGAIDWCEANGAVPAVRFDGGPYLDPERGPNWWEYYFERLSDIDPMCLPAIASDADATAFASEMKQRVAMHRGRAADIIQRCIRIRPELHEFIATYWQRHMAGRFVIGFHLRGADSNSSGLAEHAITQIEHIVRGRPPDTWRVFVVTDGRNLFERIKAQFGDHTACRATIPGGGDDAVAVKPPAPMASPLNVKESRGYLTGLAALQDAFLLSRSDVFLGYPSNLSSFVAACNPKMPWIQFSDAASSPAATAADELAVKERVIQELYQTAVERANLIEHLHEIAQERGRTIDIMHQALTKRQSRDLEKRIQALEQQSRELRHIAQPKSWRDKFRPTLFTHRQYPPREWRVPHHYTQVAAPLPGAPTIAIVTPSFNHAPYLERTIRSVLNQDYPHLYYTVQDGGSTDGTRALLDSFGKSLSWVSETDAGQADAINRGFTRVDGDIMAWLNSDDMLLPGTLNYVAKFFCDRPDIDVVYGHRVCIDEFDKDIGRVILPQHDSEAIKWMDYIPQETMFWRRRVWDALRGVDRRFQYAMDWDFILRAHAEGFKFYRLPRFLGCFRVHDAQKTTAQIEIGDLESTELRMRYLGRTVSPREHNDAVRAYVRRHVLTVRAYKLRLVQY